MQAFRTIIWVILAVLLTSFALANFTEVSVKIFPGQRADTYLTVVILASFLMGFLPAIMISIVNRWRLGRKISMQQNLIVQLSTPAPTPEPAPSASIESTPTA
ncbi:MAG: lipopolysaccharide assembly protein LapA domain-containing protein [Sphingopyxis sp.]